MIHIRRRESTGRALVALEIASTASDAIRASNIRERSTLVPIDCQRGFADIEALTKAVGHTCHANRFSSRVAAAADPVDGAIVGDRKTTVVSRALGFCDLEESACWRGLGGGAAPGAGG